MGASSRLIATLRAGEPISIMGPTGVRAKIPQDGETVIIIGGRMGGCLYSRCGTGIAGCR